MGPHDCGHAGAESSDHGLIMGQFLCWEIGQNDLKFELGLALGDMHL